jgi:hypothetical protein
MPLLPPPFSIVLNLVKFFFWVLQINGLKISNRIKDESKEIDKTAIANMMERKMTKKVLDHLKINK